MSNSICSIEGINGVVPLLEISNVVKGTICEKDVKEIEVCSVCVSFPCYWIEYDSEITEKTQVAIFEENLNESDKNIIRKKAYKFYIVERYGILGN